MLTSLSLVGNQTHIRLEGKQDNQNKNDRPCSLLCTFDIIYPIHVASMLKQKARLGRQVRATVRKT